MSQEPEKNNHGQQKQKLKESNDYYCYQLGTYYCKNQCPNDCYQRYQEKIAKLIIIPIDPEKK